MCNKPQQPRSKHLPVGQGTRVSRNHLPYAYPPLPWPRNTLTFLKEGTTPKLKFVFSQLNHHTWLILKIVWAWQFLESQNLQSCKYTLLLFGSVLVIYIYLTIFNNIKSEKQWVYSCPFLGYSNLYIAKTVVSRCNNESIKFVKTSQIILFEKNNLVTNNR